MVTARVAGTVGMKDYVVIPLFRYKQLKGLVESLPVHSYQIHVIAELMGLQLT